jgi:Domain of unknown function (DUF4382)
MSFTRSTNFQKNFQRSPANGYPRKLAIAAVVGITAAVALSLLWQTGLSQDLPPPERGTLEVRVKDHWEAIGDFARLDVTVDGLRIRPKSGLTSRLTGWKELTLSLEKLDLTLYTGKRSATIFRSEMAPGSFDAIDLKLKKVEGILRKTKGKAPVKNLVGPIRVAFSIHPQEVTLIVLDLTVMDMSDHPPRGYELHIMGYELYSNGKLVDKVPPG